MMIMTATGRLPHDEIRPGLALHVDPDVMRHNGATITAVPECSASYKHRYFLCVASGPAKGWWTPLFSHYVICRGIIPPKGKIGHPTWKGCDTFYHPQQLWLVSHEAIVAASIAGHDKSAPFQRNLVKNNYMSIIICKYGPLMN